MTIKATYWQYHNGVKDTSLLNPDAWTVDQALLDRPGSQEVQLDLFYDYRTNIPLYPQWQAYFRTGKPPMLILWGQNDDIFVASSRDAEDRVEPRRTTDRRVRQGPSGRAGRPMHASPATAMSDNFTAGTRLLKSINVSHPARIGFDAQSTPHKRSTS